MCFFFDWFPASVKHASKNLKSTLVALNNVLTFFYFLSILNEYYYRGLLLFYRTEIIFRFDVDEWITVLH